MRRILAVVLLALLAVPAQAGGIRTFHSYHGTGRSPKQILRRPRAAAPQPTHSVLTRPVGDASWWRCPNCGETCPEWRAHTLPDYFICPSCDYHQYRHDYKSAPVRVRCPHCLGMMGHSSCTQCHGSGWITVVRGAQEYDRREPAPKPPAEAGP